MQPGGIALTIAAFFLLLAAILVPVGKRLSEQRREEERQKILTPGPEKLQIGPQIDRRVEPAQRTINNHGQTLIRIKSRDLWDWVNENPNKKIVAMTDYNTMINLVYED